MDRFRSLSSARKEKRIISSSKEGGAAFLISSSENYLDIRYKSYIFTVNFFALSSRILNSYLLHVI